MRYDQPVVFVKEGKPFRQPSGDYTREKSQEFMKLAHISSVGSETRERLYGIVTQNSLTLRLLRDLTDPFDHMVIDGKKYVVIQKNRSRHKVAYVIDEVKP